MTSPEAGLCTSPVRVAVGLSSLPLIQWVTVAGMGSSFGTSTLTDDWTYLKIQFRRLLWYQLEDLVAHRDHARAEGRDLLERAASQVKAAVVDERAPVVDTHGDALSVSGVGHLEACAERESPVRRREPVRVERLAAGGGLARLVEGRAAGTNGCGGRARRRGHTRLRARAGQRRSCEGRGGGLRRRGVRAGAGAWWLHRRTRAARRRGGGALRAVGTVLGSARDGLHHVDAVGRVTVGDPQNPDRGEGHRAGRSGGEHEA